MQKKQQPFAYAVIALIAAIAFASVLYLKEGVVNKSAPPSPPAAVVLAQDAVFYDAAGKKFTLADFRGKVLLVNLWATWCPPCVAELPSLDVLQAKLHKKNFMVVAISLDRADISLDRADIKTVTDFLEARKVERLTAYWDKDRDIPLKWKYAGVPVSFLIDAEGNVIEQIEGAREWHEGEIFDKISRLVP